MKREVAQVGLFLLDPSALHALKEQNGADSKDSNPNLQENRAWSMVMVGELSLLFITMIPSIS